MDVSVLIDKLEDTIDNGRPGILGGQVRVPKEAILEILDQMRATNPEGIKQARAIVVQREEILAEARREAERIVQEARSEQTRLVAAQEAITWAKRQAVELVEEARARDREVRVGAEGYAGDILKTLELNLTKFVATVQRSRDRLQGLEEARA